LEFIRFTDFLLSQTSSHDPITSRYHFDRVFWNADSDIDYHVKGADTNTFFTGTANLHGIWWLSA
jgi:hypothetical protein